MANVYNTIYRGNFCSPSGEDNVIEFKQRMSDALPVPVPSDIIFSGHNDQPVIIEYLNKSDYKQEPINGCGCTINIKAIGDFELKSLYTADEREWLVVVTGDKNFTGYLIPDSCSEPYQSKPYDVSVQATDALGTLEDIPFQKTDSVKYKGFYSDVELLRICLEKTGLKLPMLIGINTYEVTMNRALPSLQQTFRDTARYLDADGNPFSCLEVIRAILEHWSARLHQFNNHWQIVNVLEKSRGNVKAWRFTAEGTANGFVTLGNVVIAGGIDRDIQPSSATNETVKGFKLSTAYYQYGYPTNALLNGDFDIATPPALPANWVGVAGGTGHSETRIDQTTSLPTSDHYLVIDSNGGGGGFIYNNTAVQARANQKVVISFDLEAKDAFTSSIGVYRYLGVRLTDNLGKSYTVENGWISGVDFYVIQYRGTEFSNALRVSFELIQQPTDYQLNIGIQGVSDVGSGFWSTKINNVSVQPQTVSGQTAPPLGVFNRETLNAAQTYKKDPILLLHGDEPNDQRTSRISIGSDTIITPPTFWERADIVEPISGLPERQSLLHIVANSELRNHQRPYQIFNGTFIGYGDVDINTILKIDLLSPTGWIFMSGSFDIKTGEHELRFAEVLLDEPNYVEEFAVEDYGTEKGKQGFSVGQPDSVSTPPGGSYIDTAGFALASDIPVKASAVETQAGTNDDKFITPFKLLGWWEWIKTQAATISGAWNFTSRPKFNGANLLTAADIPAETDTLNSVTTRGNTTSNDITVGQLVTSGSNSAINLKDRTNNAKLWALYASGDVFAFFNTVFGGNVLTVKSNGVPVSSTDIVRLQDLQAFAPSYIGVTANYTILTTDGTINVTGNSPTITLPTAVGVSGKIYRIKNSGTGTVTIATTSSQLIDGVTTKIINTQYSMFALQSNGANWIIIAVL